MEKLSATNKTIKLEWVPSHLDIPGNNEADEMAKAALSLNDITQLPLCYKDFRSSLKRYLYTKWQEKWDTINTYPYKTSHLYPIKPVVKEWSSVNRKSREEEVILTRLRQGACIFNKKHLFKREPAPNCVYCQTIPETPLTISHVLLECPQYHNDRILIIGELQKNNLPVNLVSLLSDEFPLNKLFEYLRRIHYVSKI